MTDAIVLAGIGTKGDVLPLLALGKELLRRGYACDLLSNEGYGERARDDGLGFLAVAPDQTNNLVHGLDDLEHHVFPSYEPTFRYFGARVAAGERPVVVNLNHFSASNLVCERYDLPLCRLYLAPYWVKSLLAPPWPYCAERGRRDGASARAYGPRELYERMSRLPALIGPVNRFRERLELSAVRTTDDIDAPIGLRLGFFPSWYASPAPDWPEPFEVVGFPLPRSARELSPDLIEFIAREGRPLVFTPGTGVANVADFFGDALACCEALGRPGLFLSPALDGASYLAHPRIRCSDYVDLDLLLPHAALLVHHGGIGTTARALEAGVPQLIRAVGYDQPDNGHRVAALGAGRFFEGARCSREKLVEAVRELVADGDIPHRLEHFRDAIARTDAVARAASCLERFVERHRV